MKDNKVFKNLDVDACIIGSMLSPFCFYKYPNKWWIMICGLQLVWDGKFHWHKVQFNQWTSCLLHRKIEKVKK